MNKLITSIRFLGSYVGLALLPVLAVLSINAWVDPSTPWAKHWGPRCDLAFTCWAALSLYAAYRLNLKPQEAT